MPSMLTLVKGNQQSNDAHVIEGKDRSRAFTHQVRDEIMYRWRYAGQTTREISRGLRLNDREAVERVIQDRLTGRGPVTPAARRVA